jgi:hypothetical protein
MVWIKVDDKLPNEGDPCIYYFKHVGVWGGKYIGMTEWGPQFASLDGFLTGDVTHWMPLPPPPSQPKIEGDDQLFKCCGCNKYLYRHEVGSHKCH